MKNRMTALKNPQYGVILYVFLTMTNSVSKFKMASKCCWRHFESAEMVDICTHVEQARLMTEADAPFSSFATLDHKNFTQRLLQQLRDKSSDYPLFPLGTFLK